MTLLYRLILKIKEYRYILIIYEHKLKRKGILIQLERDIMTYEDINKQLKCIDLWDYSLILKLSRSYAKIEHELKKDIKIAILGSCSIQLIVSVTKVLISRYGIHSDVYEGEYNGIGIDALDDNSNMYKFRPDYVIILPDYRDVHELPMLLDNELNIGNLCRKFINYYVSIWEHIQAKLPECQILHGNFTIPFERFLSNLEYNYAFSRNNFLTKVNYELMKNKPSFVTLLDFDSLASFVGKKNWFDETSYYLNKSAFSLKYIGLYCNLIASQLNPLLGKTRKCLVLDLDNTLWGGVVGDDGYNNVIVDPNTPTGEAYLAFQKYVLELKKRGVILAVCSKNEENIAKEPFLKNPYMILKLDDFACFVANWDDKVTNIRRIAHQLNIGLDSLVFFDDNPTEREIVKSYIPEILVIDVPDDPSLYVRALDLAAPFEWLQITHEDILRSNTYVENNMRDELELKFKDYEEYLVALNMEAKVEPLSQNHIARFTQLINKSNQFNLRTQRYSEAHIRSLMNNSDYRMFTISLRDKFSNYGIISCVILKMTNNICFIDTWVMSCRVIKKDVEKLAMKTIVSIAKEYNSRKIIGEYIPSKKNNLVKELYPSLGFEKMSKENDLNNKICFVFTDYDKVLNYKIREY